MRAILKYAIDIEKWTIDVETDDGEILTVGEMINEEVQLFKVSVWDIRESALEWIKSKGLNKGDM